MAKKKNAGRAGQALQQTLEIYNISQNSLAIKLGVNRPSVFRWCHGETDPTAETVVKIVQALAEIEPSASASFINFYLGELIQSKEKNPIQYCLPNSEQVDVTVLGQLFNNPTNSYKYLFFLALLDILERRDFDTFSPISFTEIVLEMLVNAWFPYVYCKLSFGIEDQITKKLNSLSLIISDSVFQFIDFDKKKLKKALKHVSYEALTIYIIRYVVYRIIRPFFIKETKGLKNDEINQFILDLANSNFEKTKPLYYFNTDKVESCNAIIFSQDWANYIEKNFLIIKGWISQEWLQYIQLKNPMTPNIANKLFIPQSRKILTSQHKFWKSVLAHESLNCIYSGELLNPDNLVLNHYLPWSFVAHDQLWNLIPVIPKINSLKSNNLASDHYFAKFVRLQHLALVTNSKYLPKQIWNQEIEPYINDLNLNLENLLNYEQLLNAYESTIKPLLILASKQGFATNWIYSQ